jgi:hypothetical protein
VGSHVGNVVAGMGTVYRTQYIFVWGKLGTNAEALYAYTINVPYLDRNAVQCFSSLVFLKIM